MDQAQVKNHMELPNWLERNKKRAFGYAVAGFGVLVIVLTLAGGNSQPKAKASAIPAANSASPATPADIQHFQDELGRAKQRVEQERLRAQEQATQAQKDLTAAGAGNAQFAQMGGSTAQSAGYPLAQPMSAPQGAATTHQDGGFLVVSASGQNTGLPVRTQQQQDIQKLIDEQKELLKKSIEAEPLAQVSQPQPPAGVIATVPVSSGPVAPKKAENDRLPAGEKYQASEGKLIPCILMNRIQGEYAGPVKAVVANDFYSDDLQHKLIPRGALLIGEAAAVDRQQQKRISVSFHRLEMPGGQYSVDLDQFVGLDQAGATALGGKVNTHLLSALLWSLPIGAVSGLSLSSTNAGYNMTGLDAYRMGVSQAEGQTANQVLSRKVSVLPTITVKEGSRIEVWVSHDLKLPEYKEEK